jgi:hypothetical protein
VGDALHVLASRLHVMAVGAKAGRWKRPHLEYVLKNGDTLRVTVEVEKACVACGHLAQATCSVCGRKEM